jgi:hypothetical protein
MFMFEGLSFLYLLNGTKVLPLISGTFSGRWLLHRSGEPSTLFLYREARFFLRYIYRTILLSRSLFRYRLTLLCQAGALTETVFILSSKLTTEKCTLDVSLSSLALPSLEVSIVKNYWLFSVLYKFLEALLSRWFVVLAWCKFFWNESSALFIWFTKTCFRLAWA